jgi:formate C-acetyltransferase
MSTSTVEKPQMTEAELAKIQAEIDGSIDTYQKLLCSAAAAFNAKEELQKEIYDKKTGNIFNARYQIRTRDDSVNLYVTFENGVVSAGSGKIDAPDVTINYRDKPTMAQVWFKGGEETINRLLTNEMNYTGNMAYLSRFSHLIGLITGGETDESTEEDKPVDINALRKKTNHPQKFRTSLNKKVDAVQYLNDPYLSEYAIEDFPRIHELRDSRFGIKPTICIERASLITKFHREYGFETDKDGNPLDPEIRQAEGTRYVLSNRKPIIWDKHLLAGSTTTKKVGIPLYPEMSGTLIWSELKSIQNRTLNPNNLSAEDAQVLNAYIFPYWQDRTVREYCKRKYKFPRSQQLDERYVLYFMMKNSAISHTIAHFEMILQNGVESLITQAAQKEKEATDQETINFYKAMQIAMEGAINYSNNLSKQAAHDASLLDDSKPEEKERKAELEELSRICSKVPAKPAETVHEAVQSIWTTFTCLHAENADSALSIGLVDKYLQPYFLADLEKANTQEEKDAVVKKSIELVASLFLKFNDHDPLIPGVGNNLFGGTSSDDTVTLGGVDRDGNTAVNDMTFIALKAAEMLNFQDPNLNARYYSGVNSPEYLRRLCEVNINMGAAPIIHNDEAIINALVNEGVSLEDARGWAASGCVEPDVCGKHYGHTNCMLLNTVAPLEMVLNDGVHPLLDEQVGPETGNPDEVFKTFEDFVEGYKAQLLYLMEQSVEINNYLGESHKYVHPTPLLSAFFEGPMEKGKDVIQGGATYNTSGVALVSISDVIDSFRVIKELVYDKKEIDFARLAEALRNNFEGPDDEKLLLRIKQIPKFGSGKLDDGIAQDLMDYMYDYYTSQTNYRGGKYLPGYWSISYHVGFGLLSGALPSGRKRGKAFTPGLTPDPEASDMIINNIHDVAGLNSEKMPNNIAFNSKLVPHPGDTPDESLDQFSGYVQSYIDLGGMQWQCNVVSTDTMRAAVEHPEDYGWLVVRISGYSAYFTKINAAMQEELIERAEYSSR